MSNDNANNEETVIYTASNELTKILGENVDEEKLIKITNVSETTSFFEPATGRTIKVKQTLNVKAKGAWGIQQIIRNVEQAHKQNGEMLELVIADTTPLSSIEFNVSTVNLQNGESLILTAHANPKGASLGNMSLTASKPEYVEITPLHDGQFKVTALKTGDVDLIAVSGTAQGKVSLTIETEEQHNEHDLVFKDTGNTELTLDLQSDTGAKHHVYVESAKHPIKNYSDFNLLAVMGASDIVGLTVNKDADASRIGALEVVYNPNLDQVDATKTETKQVVIQSQIGNQVVNNITLSVVVFAEKAKAENPSLAPTLNVALDKENFESSGVIQVKTKLFEDTVNEHSNVQFTSSDESVLTVDAQGVVTLVGEGTAKVNAVYDDANGYLGFYVAKKSDGTLEMSCLNVWNRMVTVGGEAEIIIDTIGTAYSEDDVITIKSLTPTRLSDPQGSNNRCLALNNGNATVEINTDSGRNTQYSFPIHPANIM